MNKKDFKKDLKDAILKGVGTEELWDGENVTLELTFDEEIALDEVLKVLKKYDLFEE